MPEMTPDSEHLKEILKNAVPLAHACVSVELIRENREEVSEFLAEIIEDIAMERAIAEGRKY